MYLTVLTPSTQVTNEVEQIILIAYFFFFFFTESVRISSAFRGSQWPLRKMGGAPRRRIRVESVDREGQRVPKPLPLFLDDLFSRGFLLLFSFFPLRIRSNLQAFTCMIIYFTWGFLFRHLIALDSGMKDKDIQPWALSFSQE